MRAVPAEAVTARIREAILRGDYAPRQRLIEADLCEQLGASRFTVRTALQELASEGLVEMQRNKGARVRAISIDEAVQITEVRMVLEGLCAARAAERVTPAQIMELQEIGVLMRHAVETGQLLRYSDLNARLHAFLRQIADHATASRMIEQLHAQIVRHQFTLALQPGRPAVSLGEHLKIIAALAEREPARAEQAMREHVASVVEALRALEPTQPHLGSLPATAGSAEAGPGRTG